MPLKESSKGNKMRYGKNGFTLVELLILVGVLAVLATATILVLNPAEYLAQARDSRRISDLDALNKIIDLYNIEGGSSFGSPNTVYISLPDSLATESPAAYSNCTATYPGLPALPAGWAYACAHPNNYKKIDSAGWVPINLTSLAGGSIPALPIDPINSTDRFYSYLGGSWELNAKLESARYLASSSMDGGDSSVAYEVGSNLKLSPISRTYFDFDAFPVTTGSNQPAWRKITGTSSIALGSDSGGDYGRGGYVWYEYQENIPFNPNAKYKISCRVRQISDPTTGDKRIYCGVSGVASDGVTYINNQGINSTGSQHYFAASYQALTAGAGYTTFSGYFKGHGTGAGGQRSDPNNPGKMYPGVAYIRPLFILNYSGGNGAADIDFEMLEVIE